MKSIRRSLTYIFSSICGIALLGSGVAFGDAHESIGMVKGNMDIAGNVEVVNEYTTEVTDGGAADDTTVNKYSQSGRAELVFHAKTELKGAMGNTFAEGQGSVNAGHGGVGSGDYWFKWGGDSWNVQMGKVGGAGVYTSGQDTSQVGAPGAPGKYTAGYASDGAVGGFNINFTASDSLALQLRIQYGTKDANNQIGFRPHVSFNMSGMGIVAAFDSLNETPQDSDGDSSSSKAGYALKVTGSLMSIDLGVNFTSGTVTGQDDSGNDTDDVTTSSVGAYATISTMAGSIGVGLHQTSETTSPAAGGDDLTNTHQQTFVSYVRDLPVAGTTISLGYSMASGVIDGGAADDQTNTASNLKAKFNYTF